MGRFGDRCRCTEGLHLAPSLLRRVATSIEGLDVTHAAFAYRDDDGIMRVLHAPLSGGVVEITRSPVAEYVEDIRRATGILVARPLGG
ncbi:MAG: DUF1460 domain-containing protein [Gemmatimonas sp.]|nr:DUF1460 domain-containing protein [Gemmatimonas sp.]